MKLVQEKIEILSNTIGQESAFSIDEENLPIILDILRSKLYRFPIASICREIACNGRDSHREAGVPNLPIEIEISDKTKSMWSSDGTNVIFRDFGVGISPARMEKIYTRYGSSTKRDSNDQTGGFGLGAKTPFAYVDSFTVHTIHDGTEYTWTVYIDETRVGKATLLMENPCDAPNMTEIVVPVRRGDIDEFESSIIASTHFWPVRPKLINIEDTYSEEQELVSGEKWKILKKDHYNKTWGQLNVVIDGVHYPVDSHAIPGFRPVDNGSIFLFYGNGELSVSANRENLQYDSITLSRVTADLEKVKAEILRNYRKEFSDHKTLFDFAYNFNSKLRIDNIFNWCENISLAHKGKTVTKTDIANIVGSSLDTHNVQLGMVTSGGSRKYTNVRLFDHNVYTAHTKGRVFYVGLNDTISQNFKAHFLQNTGDTVVFIKETECKPIEWWESIYNDADTLGSLGINFQYLNDVVLPKAPRKERAPVETKVKVFHYGKRGYHRRDDCIVDSVQFNQIEHDKAKVFAVSRPKETDFTKDLCHIAEAMTEYLGQKVKIVGLTSRKVKDHSIPCLDEYLRTNKDQIIKSATSAKIRGVLTKYREFKDIKIPELDVLKSQVIDPREGAISLCSKMSWNVDLDVQSQIDKIDRVFGSKYPLIGELYDKRKKQDYIKSMNELFDLRDRIKKTGRVKVNNYRKKVRSGSFYSVKIG
jgi:hypothetical protein